MRFGICGANFEVVWWESLAYLLGLWGGLFVGLVFVLAMGGAMYWILAIWGDFLELVCGLSCCTRCGVSRGKIC